MSLPAGAQEGETERDREAVKKAVETYLYAEEAGEKRNVLYPEAKIISLNSNGKGIRETPVSRAAGKRPPGGKTSRVLQKIVSIDLFEDGASVKVMTDMTSWGLSPTVPQKHFQYISLFKLRGEWKIVNILMPTTYLLIWEGK